MKAYELRVIRNKLLWAAKETEVVKVRDSNGPGNIVTVEIASENITELFTGFGMKNKIAGLLRMRRVWLYWWCLYGSG